MKLTYSTLPFKAASWPDKTYRARHKDYSYCVDYDGRWWRLRIWHGGVLCQDQQGGTVRELMERADAHAGGGSVD